MNLRVGSGFDLHRLKHGRPFILGGVLLDWPAGPYGHSDGDPLTHALADALLGASGLGDIGDHFPDNDPAWRDCPGETILTQVMDKVRAAGFEVVNADMTVFLQAPKLKTRKQAIRETLSRWMGIESGQICLKAKTAEGFDALGRGDCIAAQVTILLQSRQK